MPITQTVEITADRRITVPSDVPTGKTIISFTPVAEKDIIEFADASNEEVMAIGEEILNKHISAFKALAQ